MQPVVVGLNIKSASVEALEALSIHHSDNSRCLGELIAFADLKGAVILSTCNRLEFYAVADELEFSIMKMRVFLAGRGATTTTTNSNSNSNSNSNNTSTSTSTSSVTTTTASVGQGFSGELPEQQALQESIYDHAGKAAIRHLFRVACGLDSMVLGETEILGQVARAYESAHSVKATDKILNVWFQRALSVGKLVRTGAGIDQYHTSVGRIAVDLAQRELGDIKDKQILVLGAGEMSELTMKHLASKAASLVMVSNRSLSKAQALAAEHGFEACSLQELELYLEKADLVFSATSSKRYLVTYLQLKDIMAKRQQRPLVFIDMAVPRDIDPRVAALAGVSYFDIKQLRDVSDQNRSLREQAAATLNSIIDEKAKEFTAWLKMQGNVSEDCR